MSIPTEAYVPRLPAELWLLIFHFATSAPTSIPYYEPFQPCPDTTAALSDAVLRDKCALALVCKQWRLLLARDLLYEDIRIGQGITALHAALSESPIVADCDYAARPPRYRVRRAVLPYTHTATPTRHAPPALALLALLPHLEVLVRPPHNHHHHHRHHRHQQQHCHRTSTSFVPSPRFEFPTTTPALPVLRRLEWAFYTTGAAARAGGINALDDVLRAAPSLHELVLLGPMPLSALRQHRLHLRALRTLRLHAGAAACPFVARQMTYWAFPALENVVVMGPASDEALEALWEAFAGQVRVLEVQVGGAGGVAALSMEDVGKIVGACPMLEELNVRLGVEDFGWLSSSEGVPQTWTCAHDAMQRLGVCVDTGEWMVKTWRAVAMYVAQFGKGCPALRYVALYMGDVGAAAQNPEFHALRDILISDGRELILRPVHA